MVWQVGLDRVVVRGWGCEPQMVNAFHFFKMTPYYVSVSACII